LGTVLLTIGFWSGPALYTQINFLEVFPHYTCSLDKNFTSPFECAPHYKKKENITGFCGTDFYYKVDWSNEASLDNWVLQLNLECKILEFKYLGVQKTTLAFIGMAFFIGWASTALVTPRISGKG
jgi:hypothetical protein